jgi:hypothetical protein
MLPLGFFNSVVTPLMGLVYTFSGTPYAPIYSQIPVESIKPACEANTSPTALDSELCQQWRWGLCDVPGYTINHFDVTSTICGSATRWIGRGNRFSPSIEEAYFANGTTWKKVMIMGPWQSVQKSLKCLADKSEVMSKIECVALTVTRHGDTLLTYLPDRIITIDISNPGQDIPFKWKREHGVPLARPEDVSSGTYTLIHTLSQLPNIQELRLGIPVESAADYRQVMETTAILPINATRLKLGAFTDRILRHTPKVNDISVYETSSNRTEAQVWLVPAVMGKQLEHLELCSDENLPHYLLGMINEDNLYHWP